MVEPCTPESAAAACTTRQHNTRAAVWLADASVGHAVHHWPGRSHNSQLAAVAQQTRCTVRCTRETAWALAELVAEDAALGAAAALFGDEDEDLHVGCRSTDTDGSQNILARAECLSQYRDQPHRDHRDREWLGVSCGQLERLHSTHQRAGKRVRRLPVLDAVGGRPSQQRGHRPRRRASGEDVPAQLQAAVARLRACVPQQLQATPSHRGKQRSHTRACGNRSNGVRRPGVAALLSDAAHASGARSRRSRCSGGRRGRQAGDTLTVLAPTVTVLARGRAQGIVKPPLFSRGCRRT